MSKFKAAFFITSVCGIWGSMIVIQSPFMLCVWLYDQVTTPRHSWLENTALAQDLRVNVIMGGDKKTYVSSILGHLQATSSEGGTTMALFVNWFWVRIFKEENHCIKAMQPTDIYDWSASRAILGTALYIGNLYLIFMGTYYLWTHYLVSIL